MTPNRSYVTELFAVLIGVIYSPMVFYYFLRYKFKLENEQIKHFRVAYTGTLKEPKTHEAQMAEATVYVVLIVLVYLGYSTNEVAFDSLAAALGFSLGVDWLWRMDVR